MTNTTVFFKNKDTVVEFASDWLQTSESDLQWTMIISAGPSGGSYAVIATDGLSADTVLLLEKYSYEQQQITWPENTPVGWSPKE